MSTLRDINDSGLNLSWLMLLFYFSSSAYTFAEMLDVSQLFLQGCMFCKTSLEMKCNIYVPSLLAKYEQFCASPIPHILISSIDSRSPFTYKQRMFLSFVSFDAYKTFSQMTQLHQATLFSKYFL